MTKPAVYAEQGDPVLLAHRRGGRERGPLQTFALDPKGMYVQEAELGPGESATLEHPWSVTVDMTEFILHEH